MGRVKPSVARGRRPVILHLDRAVAHDLLQSLTQALEPLHREIKEKPEGSAPESKKRDGKERKRKSKRKKS